MAPKCYPERSEESRFRSNDETRFAQGDNDEDQLLEIWVVTAFENLCEGFQYGTSAKSQKSGKVPVLRMGNIQNGKIDWTDLAYTSDEDEINKFILRKGDVLFNRTNSPELVGKSGIYKGERPAIFAGYLIRIKNYPELNSEYLNYCLNTVYAREFCQQVKTDGVSQSNVNAQKLGKFPLPLPPHHEQHEIVRRVEALFKKANEIEVRYKKGKAFGDRLTLSILVKTFRGELVSQDQNDEPASFILEKIRAVKLKHVPNKRENIKIRKSERRFKMKAYEYYADVLTDGQLSIPEDLKDKLKPESKVRLMLLLDEDAVWNNFTMSQFLKEYSEEDSIYDKL